MGILELSATLENFEPCMDFIRRESVETGFDEATVNQILLASEEIVANVINYAYAGSPAGLVNIRCDRLPNGISITVSDSGMPFDPLARQDPNIQLPGEERQIGGLGIYMTKQIMSEVRYARQNDRNILTMTKLFPDPASQT